MAAEQIDDRDAQIGRIINEYLDRKQSGDAVCEDDLLQAHPQLADDLRAHFGMVRQVVSVSSPGSPLADPGPALASDFLPGYEILGEIHRGGQGVVYRALQKATRREVAIKVTREGPFAGWRDRARFEREVHVLGALRHPSIVTIHDSGVAAGSQYFVMDYISGSPLDLWIEQAPRTIEQILRLFLTICDAINAAHIKGIIHRDLKPGNIRIDADNQPHILDFGLAKVTTEPDLERAGMTLVGQFVGSLPWTSPEQAQGSLDQIDTRTDVYALGVILYQLLTRQFPYEVSGPVRDVLNRVVTSDPVRPGSLRPEINKDVDAIVQKCLRKEPHRRYQTAGELGRDIERHLNGEPVAARSDSGLYVLSKMLRRYRAPVAVASAFALLVAASLFGALSLWGRAVVQRDRAIDAERRADVKAAEAESARTTAERESAIAQAQAQRLQRLDYFKTIKLAQNAYEQRYMAQAQRLLETCPPGLREWEWDHLLRLCRTPLLLNVAADPRSVPALAVSPDGQRIATGGWDGAIKIWDAHTGAAITQLDGHTLQVQALAWSPNGRWIASAGLDRTLRLWEVDTASARILEQTEGPVNAVAFSPDSSSLVSGGLGKVLTFHEIPNGRIIHRTKAHEGEVLCIAYSPDGRHVASGESLNPLQFNTSKVRLWDVTTGESTTITEHSASILSVAFSPDGSRLASGSSMPPAGRSAHGTLRISNSTTGDEIRSLRGHEGFVDAVAFSPDGKLLASAGAPSISESGTDPDHTVKIWDAETGAENCIYSAHAGGGRALAWSPQGDRLFSTGNDGRLKAWPTTPPAEARVLRGHSGTVLRVAFSPDGRRIASSAGQAGTDRPAASDDTVRVWNLETGAQQWLTTAHKDAVLGLAWSPDGKLIASGSADGTVRLWNSDTGLQRWVLGKENQTVQSVAFSPDTAGPGLLGAIMGNTATFWRITDAREVRQLRQSDTLAAITFSPDGQWVATAAVDGVARIWNSQTGVESRSISTGSGLSSAAFSPDSRIIATGHTNGTIALWDAPTGKPLVTMAGTQRAVQSMVFSPDGQRIASCSTDAFLRLWDVGSGSEVYVIRAHDAPMTGVAFSPDGRQIATCAEDGLIKIWDTRAETATRPAGKPAGGHDADADGQPTRTAPDDSLPIEPACEAEATSAGRRPAAKVEDPLWRTRGLSAVATDSNKLRIKTACEQFRTKAGYRVTMQRKSAWCPEASSSLSREE